MTNFKVDVHSDPICPWSYFGKSRLDRAMSAYRSTVPGGSEDTFTLSWHPVYLDPTLPKVGVPVATHLAERFGAQRAAIMTAKLQEMGAAEGLPCKARGPIGHTRDAHRLVQLAGQKGPEVQTRVVAQFFQSAMEEDMDITSLDQLADAAAKAGIARDEAKQWLDGGQGGDEVDREIDEAAARGIKAPPYFTINGKYELEGAPEVEKLVQTFMRAKAEGA